MSFEIPDTLGPVILEQLATVNPDKAVGFLLLAVSHGQPLATMTNLPEEEQLYLLGLVSTAMAEGMNVSHLLNPEGSA